MVKRWIFGKFLRSNPGSSLTFLPGYYDCGVIHPLPKPVNEPPGAGWAAMTFGFLNVKPVLASFTQNGVRTCIVAIAAGT
jgi:hypothetical protein